MIRIVLSGCGGAMGRCIARRAAEREDCVIVAGIDPATSGDGVFPVFADPASCTVPADVVIDFSHPSALDGLLEHAVARGLPLVVATTGLSAAQVVQIEKASEQVPVFFTANMSLGVNLMRELAKTAARVLGLEFDIEIVEKHHNRKIDAPSGTALMLADAVAEVLPEPHQYVYDRHSRRQKRARNEIGLHAVRGGTIVGEHEILFAGPDEVLSIAHTAYSKEVFAGGALSAAVFLSRKGPGLYDMQDMIADGSEQGA